MIGERTSTWSIEYASSFFTALLVEQRARRRAPLYRSPGPARRPPPRGPSTRSRSGSTMSPPSTSGVISRPCVVPQSICGDHQVLRDVDETAREVARVRGLQRRVGETLAGAVRRDEVLQDVQAFAEVRRDRRLDDRAVRLRHQAAHAGELPNLRRAAARAGVGHHVDRVERLLLAALARAFEHRLDAELFHHRFRDLIVRARPDVDDLVVALAVGHETGRVLVLDVLDFALGASRIFSFSTGTTMSFTPNDTPARVA